MGIVKTDGFDRVSRRSIRGMRGRDNEVDEVDVVLGKPEHMDDRVYAYGFKLTIPK